ncbi:putative LigA [Burkholderia vietnamiensis]|nr:putative LigA [Burkholderia vietnamiensis]
MTLKCITGVRAGGRCAHAARAFRRAVWAAAHARPLTPRRVQRSVGSGARTRDPRQRALPPRPLFDDDDRRFRPDQHVLFPLSRPRGRRAPRAGRADCRVGRRAAHARAARRAPHRVARDEFRRGRAGRRRIEARAAAVARRGVRRGGGARPARRRGRRRGHVRDDRPRRSGRAALARAAVRGARGHLRRAARRRRPARRARRGRDGQARRPRAERVVGHRPDLRLRGRRRDGRRHARAAVHAGVLHAARPAPDRRAVRGHRRRLRVSRRHAAASQRRFRAARMQPRDARGILLRAGARMGALCMDQGAARVGRRQRRGAAARIAARSNRQAVRLPPLSRFRRDRRDPFAASADPARGRAPRVDAARQGRRHQARARRHPRDRIQRAGVPADPRRPGRGVPRAADARGAAPCAGARADRRGRARAADRRVQLPAHARASAAVSRRRADPRDAGRSGRAGGARRVARFCRLRGAHRRARCAPDLRRGAVRPDLRRQGQWRRVRVGRRRCRRLDMERRARGRRRRRDAARAPRRPRLRRSGRGARPAARDLAVVALCRSAGKEPAALRQRRAARARGRAADRRRAPRRDGRAIVRSAGDGQPARRLSRAAHRVPGRARSRAVGARHDALGRRLSDSASAIARRAARRRGDREPVRLARVQGRAARAARRRRRPRAADGPAAARTACGGVPHPADRPGRPAVGRARERPAVRARRCSARRDHRGRLVAARETPSRRAEVRGDRIRQARRQGARLCVGSRSDLPVRRPGRALGGRLYDVYAAAHHVAHHRDRRGRAVRHRPAAAAERRGRAARHRSRCVPPLPAARRRCGEYRVGLGAPGADARAVQRRRRADRRGLRGDPPTGADDAARCGRARAGNRRHARQGVRRSPEPQRAVRPEARSRRDGRHRVHRPVLGAAACVERCRADPQHRQHRAAARSRAVRADGGGRGGVRRRRVPQIPEAAAQAAARRDGEGARRPGGRGRGAGGCYGAVGAGVRGGSNECLRVAGGVGV